MTLERLTKDRWALGCDYCVGRDEVTLDGDFDTAVEQIKELGWKKVPTMRGWLHKCPSCVRPSGVAEFGE